MSTIIGNPIMLGGGSGISAPIIGKDFNWTGGDGTYQVLDDGDGNWRIKFLSSGTFTPQKNMTIDVFCVGGGGGGIYMTQTSRHYGAGGAGGYTKTGNGVVLTAGISYAVEIGAGGSAYQNNSGTAISDGGAGGRTSGFGISANGGGGAYYSSPSRYGGNGGSGGGGGGSPSPGCDGGSDGSNGVGSWGGTGQGTTTREFGEESGDLYAGGGGSVYDVAASIQGGLGGDGGGGIGNKSAGEANTGGGGGAGYAGGSGIVIIRKHKEAAA